MSVKITGSSSVTIDGRTFSGRSISISGDKVVVDGVEQSGTLVGSITVTVNGNADYVSSSSGDIRVSGECGTVSSTSGDIQCGNVTGSVSTVSGDINAGSIAGSAKTVSGDISGSRR